MGRVINGDSAAAPAAAAMFSAAIAAAGAPLGWLLHLREVTRVEHDVVLLAYEREEHGLASGLSVVEYYVPLPLLRSGSAAAMAEFIERRGFLEVEEQLREAGTIGEQAQNWSPPPDFPFGFRPSSN